MTFRMQVATSEIFFLALLVFPLFFTSVLARKQPTSPDGVKFRVPVTQQDVEKYHQDAKTLVRKRQKENVEFILAGLRSARESQADLKKHLSDGSMGMATKDAYSVFRQPLRGLTNYARNTVVDKATSIQHSAVVRSISPRIKSQDDLRDKNISLIGKHQVRSDHRAQQMEKLRSGSSRSTNSPFGINEDRC